MSGLLFTLSTSDGTLLGLIEREFQNPQVPYEVSLAFSTTTILPQFSPVLLLLPYAPPPIPNVDQSFYLNQFLQNNGFYLGQPYVPQFFIPNNTVYSDPFYVDITGTSGSPYNLIPISSGSINNNNAILNLYSPGAKWGDQLPLGSFQAFNFPTINGYLQIRPFNPPNSSQMLFSPTACINDCAICGTTACVSKDPLNSDLFTCSSGTTCQPVSPVQIAFGLRQQITATSNANVITYSVALTNPVILLASYLPQTAVPVEPYSLGNNLVAPPEYWFFADLPTGATGLTTGTTYPLYIFDQNNTKLYLYSIKPGFLSTIDVSPTPSQYPNYLTFTPSVSGNWGAFVFPPSDFTLLQQFLSVLSPAGKPLPTNAPLALISVPSAANPAVSGNNLPALSISPTTLPNGTVNIQYSQQLSVRSTIPPSLSSSATIYTWSVSSNGQNGVTGSTGLPVGLLLNSATGLISGTPLAPGSSTFTINVNDNNGNFGTQTYSNLIISSSNNNNGGGTGATGGVPPSNSIFPNFPLWGWAIIIIVFVLIIIIVVGLAFNPIKPKSPDIELSNL